MAGRIRKAIRAIGRAVQVFKSSNRFFDDTKTKKGQLSDDARGWLDAYKRCVWVRRCIDLRANAIAGTPLKLYKRMNDGSLEEIKQHPALALLAKPNTFTERNQAVLWRTTEIDVNIIGQAFWYLERLGGKEPQQIYRIPAPYMRPVASASQGEYISKYEYEPKNSRVERIEYSPQDIIHFRLPNPDDSYNGLSVVQSVLTKVNLLLQADEWNAKFFENGARYEGFLSFKEILDREEVELAQESLQSMNAGVENAHKIGVFGGDATFIPATVSPKDADWTTSQDKGRDATCAGFGVPVFLVAGNEAAHFATAGTQKLSLWDDALIPQLCWYADTLSGEYLPQFPLTDGMFMGFDLTEVAALQERMFVKQERLQKATGTAVMSINEAREILNLDPLDREADGVYIPINMIAVGQDEVLVRTAEEERGEL